MALLKNITNSSGVSAEYWRISYISGYYPNDIKVTLLGYVSRDFRLENRPVDQYEFAISADMTRPEIYSFIKQSELFQDSLDA